MTEPAPSPTAWSLAATRALVRHPALWPTALSQVWRLAGKGWWRRPPFLPLPDRAYLRFRVHTAYGVDRDPDPADIVTWLQWCRAWRRVAG